MLKSVGYRLQIRYVQQERGQPGYVELSAVPIEDYSEKIELSQDSRLNLHLMKIKRYQSFDLPWKRRIAGSAGD